MADEVKSAYEEQIARQAAENRDQAVALTAALNKITSLERKIASLHQAALRVVEVARSRP